jgi:manganese transport protein
MEAVKSMEQAHQTLVPLLGLAAGLAFAVTLLASGIASSTTATLAGQVVMEAFLRVRIMPWLRRFIFRLLVMIPAVLAVAFRLDPLNILVLSQASLSFQLPFATIPLLAFTSDRRLMGEFTNSPWTTALALLVIGPILFLNGLLVYRLLGGIF